MSFCGLKKGISLEDCIVLFESFMCLDANVQVKKKKKKKKKRGGGGEGKGGGGNNKNQNTREAKPERLLRLR